jgi:hypothetical protein
MTTPLARSPLALSDASSGLATRTSHAPRCTGGGIAAGEMTRRVVSWGTSKSLPRRPPSSLLPKAVSRADSESPSSADMRLRVTARAPASARLGFAGSGVGAGSWGSGRWLGPGPCPPACVGTGSSMPAPLALPPRRPGGPAPQAGPPPTWLGLNAQPPQGTQCRAGPRAGAF